MRLCNKIISKTKAKELVQTLGEFCSTYQRNELESEVFLCDRVKTTQKNILLTIGKINFAMSTKYYGKKRTPTRITFKYMKYVINDIHSQVERRKGSLYKVSPYKLIINDGNYYLLAFDDKSEKMRTYRVAPAAMNMIQLLAIRTTALLPVQHGKMYPKIGYAPFADSARIHLRKNESKK